MTTLSRALSLLRTYRHESRFSLTLFITILASLILSHSLAAESAEAPFRLTLFAEPTTLDPQMLSSASGNYITTLIHRGLYRYDTDKGLIPDEGHCQWEDKGRTTLTCSIFESSQWSDGSKVSAVDYQRAFNFLADSKNGSPQAELLSKIKAPIKVLGPQKFQITFVRPDADFLSKLIHPALYPRHKSHQKEFVLKKNLITNGAFFLKSFSRGQSFTLARSPWSKTLNQQRKNLIQEVQALIVDSDTTSLNLFEAGKINLVRRVPTENFHRYKNHPGFYQFSVLRFDYIGFSPELRPFPDLRHSLASSFTPSGFQKLFKTKGKPGCPPIPNSFFEGSKDEVCYQKSPKKIKKQKWPDHVKPVLAFSEMGGDDIRRAAEWFQSQWKAISKVDVELESRDQKVYLNWLKASPPSLFRKGLSLDRPTCLAALENFKSNHPENFIRLNEEEFDGLVEELEGSILESKTKELCKKGLNYLIQKAHLIPLGEMEFSLLIDPKYEGVRFNSLNQLDLRDLRLRSRAD